LYDTVAKMVSWCFEMSVIYIKLQGGILDSRQHLRLIIRQKPREIVFRRYMALSMISSLVSLTASASALVVSDLCTSVRKIAWARLCYESCGQGRKLT
jgi:hypothetical protein